MFKNLKYWAIALSACISCRVIAQPLPDKADTIVNISHPDMWAYDVLHLPVLHSPKPARPIVVAIVDDGFSFTHKDCKNYFYRNPNEVPGNGIDDDKNGYIDDVYGWDVADNDNEVSIPKGKEDDFYHGTMVMSVVIKVAERCFGAGAPNYIRIMPVKALPDKFTLKNMEAGYDGIGYAVRQGADIIICAWSGGKYDREKYQWIFNEAEKKGITIIGSGGNFYSVWAGNG